MQASEKRKLGSADLEVPVMGFGGAPLGNMYDGFSDEQARATVRSAYDLGLRFFDTAPLYGFGLSEHRVGEALRWQDRESYVLSTKVGRLLKPADPATLDGGLFARILPFEGVYDYSYDGAMRSVEASLQRLQTDYIDLYQLHWPNRGSYHFRKYWDWDPHDLELGDVDGEIADMLGEVQKLQSEGKLKHFGLSNETAWGTRKWLEASERHGLPRVVSIQNEYSLICRIFDLDLAEVAVHEKVGLLAYSPLGASALSGKYLDGAIPAGSRRSMQPNLNGRYTAQAEQAIARYSEVAARHGLDLAQMALAFCLTRPFMTSVIIGATSMHQLKTNLAAANVELGDDVMADILKVFRDLPRPM